MTRIPLAIVGCGGMGGRHLLGLKELYDSGQSNVELVAACDLRRDNAEALADDAERLLGRRPRVFQDMAAMVATIPDLQGVDITTDSSSHHTVACAAFELGLNVLCEKPLGLTIRACNRILEARQRSGKVLSVAENYRRDPMSRLMRALIEAGAIGTPTLLFDISASGGNRIIILPWRHDHYRGGIVLDAGVHNADMMQYFMGNAHEVYAHTRVLEPVRYRGEERTNLTDFYQRWAVEIPESIEATAEDTLVSVLTFESGVLGQWTNVYAAHGEGFGRMVVYGSEGSLRFGGARNGHPLTLCRDDCGEVSGHDILSLAPGFRLDPLTAQLFGGDRLASYGRTFQEADRKLLAFEYHEFADCVLTGATPEVDGLMGRKAAALCYAAFESATLDRPVTLKEIESEATGAYEADINARIGL
jgi:predicted dehydrogenase